MRLICDLTPHVSDAVSLGTSSLMFSDLFVASGSVINFNNGDMLLTHSSNALTVSGGQLTVTGELEATSLDINGNAVISGGAVALANQPALPLSVDNTGSVDGRVFINVKHTDISTASAMGAGLQMQAGAVTSGTASYFSSQIFLQSASPGNHTVHSAPKGYKFYVDNHDTAAGAGTGYTAFGDLALSINEDRSIDVATNLNVDGILEGDQLDINGNADISGNLTGVDTLTCTDLTIGSDATTAIGKAYLKTPNVSAVSYQRINANETLSLLNAAQMLSAIGGVDGSAYLELAGGTMSGAIAMGSQNITGAGTITGTTLTGTSLDINGAADISGALTGVDALTMSGILDITGTTDSSNATGDTGILRCEGGASIAKKLYVGSTITGSADVIAFSDRKLKENIETLDGKKVLDMRGVSFTRKDTGLPSSGVIAQEIQKVAPELVHDTEGTLGVAYGNLVGYLIEAVKDQQKQIDELKAMCNGCSK